MELSGEAIDNLIFPEQFKMLLRLHEAQKKAGLNYYYRNKEAIAERRRLAYLKKKQTKDETSA